MHVKVELPAAAYEIVNVLPDIKPVPDTTKPPTVAVVSVRLPLASTVPFILADELPKLLITIPVLPVLEAVITLVHVPLESGGEQISVEL